MATVPFKTLDARQIYQKLMDVDSRLTVLQDLVDKVWNEAETSHVLPILADCSRDVGEVYMDITLDGQKAGAPAESEG